MESPIGRLSKDASNDESHEKDDDQQSATTSIKPAHIVEADYGADTELRRILSTRHLTMIALGSSIGMGLWLGSGQSLVKGGPVALFLGYLVAGSIIWCVAQSIGELAVLYPVPSAFVQWSGKFISEPAAFTLGWAYWFNYLLTIGNELTVRDPRNRLVITRKLIPWVCRLLSRSCAIGQMLYRLLHGLQFPG